MNKYAIMTAAALLWLLCLHHLLPATQEMKMSKLSALESARMKYVRHKQDMMADHSKLQADRKACDEEVRLPAEL